jgi:branched-chain amino acid transport system substrate-binding protein
VIGHLNSGTTIPASRIYSNAGIPQISPSATATQYTNSGFKTTFRVVANDGQLGGTLGRYAAGQLKAKSIAVVDDRSSYGVGVADEFIKGVKSAGGTIVGREFTNDKATDFSAILTSIKAKKPDVVFFGGMDAVGGPMLRKKSLDAFKARFKAKYKLDVQIYAPYVYDAVNVMVDAMVRAGSSEPAKYLPFLAKTEGYKGVTGLISFDAKGDIKNGALTLYTYKGGERSLISVVR